MKPSKPKMRNINSTHTSEIISSILFKMVLLFIVGAGSVYAEPPSPVSAEVLSLPQSASKAQSAVSGFPTGDFTVEGYVYFPFYPYAECALLNKGEFCEITISRDGSYYDIYVHIPTGTPGEYLRYNAYGYYSTVSSDWHHVAVGYDASGGGVAVFLDGVQKTVYYVGTITYTPAPSTDAMIGYTDSSNPAGRTFYIDEVRVSSTLRYTSNFTPATVPFTSDGSTSALWHFDDGNGAATFSDASPNGNTLTGYNSAQILAGAPNEAPTNIVLSSESVAENQPVGTLVGSFTTEDPDSGDTHTYSLVSGTGDDDNTSFTISTSNLQTAASFNYEIQNSYSILVETDDGNGGTYQKVFIISVTDEEEAPPIILDTDYSSGSNVVIQWSSISNHLYSIHHSTNLVSGFTVLESNLPCTPPMNTYTDSVNGVNVKFWKVSTDE